MIDVVRVSVGLARRAIKAAEFAVNVANVGRVEVAIDVKVSRASVLLSTNSVCQLAERVEIVCSK